MNDSIYRLFFNDKKENTIQLNAFLVKNIINNIKNIKILILLKYYENNKI